MSNSQSGPPTHVFDQLPHSRPDGGPEHENGAAISALFANGGPGTTVFLRPRATYVLYSQIDMSHPGTTLATEGYPEFESGNQAILETRGEKESSAVRMFNLPRCALKRVHVRGCRGWGSTAPTEEEKERWKKEGRMGWLEGGGALVWMGGPEAHEQIVEGCRLEDPRGWTCVHLVDFAQRCRVVNNFVGPSGQQGELVTVPLLRTILLTAGNTVFDATDGAIVLFCAPGTVCTDNTIIARERNLLGAINMVDDFPFDRDFTETRVIANKIKTEGAFIRVAIAGGPTSWDPWGPHHTLNYGGHVLHNLIGPGQFGYGITLSGVDNFTILGNTLAPHTRFAGSTHRFYPATINAPPSAFVRQWVDRGRVLNSEVQDEFVEGELQWVIGIEPEVGDKLEYEAGQVGLDVRGLSRAGEGGLAMRGARWEVSSRGELVLRKVEGKVDQFGQGEYGKGRVIWSSGRAGGGHGTVEEPQLDFLLDGQVRLRSRSGKGDVLWDPTSYLVPYLSRLPPPPSIPPPTSPQPPEKWLLHPKLILQNEQPYVQIKNHEGNLVFSTRYEWGNEDGWTMKAGQWIAVAPRELRGLEEPSGFDEEEERPLFSPTPVPRPRDSPSQGGGGHFSRFVRDLNSQLESHGVSVPSLSPRGPPPPIPPRPGAPPSFKAKDPKPTFLYLSPQTSQLILHSSPSGPTSPTPSDTHFSVPPHPTSPSRPEESFLAFQGDGNLVLYTSDGPVWASGTNGDRQAVKVVLKGYGEGGEEGPRMEMLNERGGKVWSSRG
ncbi:bulb-type lectin domain containing protein [Rhodotorula toruloides]|uniref:Bulb-type lectin domain containing protein n=1 Tax=Rhodotorula toruloides TaxID=5286 RepID=A0A511KDP7_RHOTO|nr:bulb-type lectin domain containing protein [Rhodotorula toruloides]